MAAQAMSSLQNEYQPQADLRKMMAQHPLPEITPGLIHPNSMAGDEPTKQARAVLKRFNAALAGDDTKALESCFFDSQAYWKDQLALTYHLRTFTTSGVIGRALLETKKLRDISGEIAVDDEAHFIPVMPTLQFIDCGLVFRTGSPAARCKGKMVLLPVKNEEVVEWKIWILSTILEGLDVQPEDESLLQSPGRNFKGLEFEIDVFIVGGGNAAVALAARLKALGVESVMAEQNAQVGDNWALRYDCMRFHVPTSVCDLPYMPYDKELRAPHYLTRDELASQVRRYVAEFNLNVITSARVQSTLYDASIKSWVVKFQTPAGTHTVVSKHLVQATGIGSQKLNLPPMEDSHLYQGTSIHSAHYKNANELRDKGAKSAFIIGSANTAFDVLEDCHAAGLQTTMVVRSPTYIVPVEHVCDKHSFGAYDEDVKIADKLFMTMPTFVDSHLAHGLMAQFASREPLRYEALAASGFPVIDSQHPDAALMHNLIERGGGHYVDVGGTKLLEEGKAKFKAGVEPVAYTATGLRFSDGSSADADAVVWCTGYSDKNVRTTASDILGNDGLNDLLDATWGIDSEGEIRGMWKRHLHVDNFWVMGGHTQQHRWHSRTVALQIKAALEGVLPPAYRDTPVVVEAKDSSYGEYLASFCRTQ